MTKPEWGAKRTCQSCEARFYDMERSPIVCPKCGEVQTEIVKVATKLRADVAKKPDPKMEKIASLDDDDIDLDDLDVEDVVDDDDDDLIDDSSMLDDDDDDDMSDLIEHIDPKEKDE